MADNADKELRVLQLRFIGKILAGFTHESRNYLAIIKESAGLVGDMMQLGKSIEESADQYLETIRSIEDQVERSTRHCKYLSRFSHRMDIEFSSFACNDLMEELMALVHRFANQKRIELAADFQQDLPDIYGNPSLIQFLVFGFLEKNLMELAQKSRLVIRTESAGGPVAISIISEGAQLDAGGEKTEFPFEVYNGVAKRLGGTISIGEGRVTFTLPVKAPNV